MYDEWHIILIYAIDERIIELMRGEGTGNITTKEFTLKENSICIWSVYQTNYCQ